MSLKKRMFRSNMMILCSALVSLMLIIIAVLLLFEDSFEQQFHSISQTALERHASEAAEAVELWSGMHLKRRRRWSRQRSMRSMN